MVPELLEEATFLLVYFDDTYIFSDSGSFFSLHSRVMSSKQATSPFASVVDGDDAMSQEHLSWEKEEGAEAHCTPQLPLHNLLHGKAHPDEMQPLSSVPPETDWESLVSAQQRMVRHAHINQNTNCTHTEADILISQT